MTSEASSSGRAEDREKGGGAETPDSTVLRRSGLETPLKNIRCPSPASSRKSARLEKATPTPPVLRKSERLEKLNTPIALRRSERGKKSSSSNSSGSQKSNKLGVPVVKRKLKKQKSASQLGLESRQGVAATSHIGRKVKDTRACMETFKPKAAKLNVLGSPSSRNISTGKKSDEKVQELRDESAGKDVEKASPNCHASQLPNELDVCLPEHGDIVKDANAANGGDGPLLSADKTVSRKLELDNETRKKNMNSELVNTTPNDRVLDSDTRLEISLEEISLKRKRDEHDPESDSTAMTSSKDICPSVVDAINSFASANKIEDSCASCFKRKRDYHTSKQEDLCLCGPKSNQDGNGAEVTGKPIFSLQPEDISEDIQLDGDQNACLTCKLGGKLLFCEGKDCKRSYHVSCLDPPLEDIPLEVWYCLACVEKKIKLGAHSVSEGIEAIWKVEMPIENGSEKKLFFVKYKGLAHVHNKWVSESLLLLQAPSLVEKFNQEHQVSSWKDEWTEPHRMLKKRLIRSPKKFNEAHGGHAGDVVEWLVKWRSLDHENATWELESASFMMLPKAQSLIRSYEHRLERAMKRIHKEVEIEKGSVKPMQLADGGSTEIRNIHLEFCNSLREQWHRGKNVIIINDPERISKVISFIASLSSDGRWPFLIITSSAVMWDQEFFLIAPSIAAVIYHGSKDTRRKMRTMEFYAEGGGVMFDVLITYPEVIVEDLDVIRSIKWEVVIVDDFQCSKMYSHFGQFKSLSTTIRLLLVNGQLKGGVIEHLLPLLDCHDDTSSNEGLITNSDDGIHDLKEKLSKLVDGFKADTSRFVEYWVPAQISNAQLEQYCATLLSNSLPLCSSSNSKRDCVGTFRDIVISNRKCCDHPYITDMLLAKHLTKDLQVTDFLDVGINASGKLRLLDAMLREMRKRELRVLILFQSSGGSPKDNIGDILDDFVRQRFGENSYERLDVLAKHKRKQTALKKFNSQKSRFVFLLETRACLPSIELSSVDTVIIFGSDWNPLNDIRSLQRLTLDTQSQQLKIFRLYSIFTVEENSLILATHGKPLDSDLQRMNRAMGHNLLMWGASCLFYKLDDFHGCPSLATRQSTSYNSLSDKDVISEFLNMLTQKGNDYTSSSSIILKAKHYQGKYSTDFPLPSEKKIQESDTDLPHLFWKKLLDGKQPQWKYTSGLSQSNRRRAQHRDEVLEKAEGEIEGAVKKRKIVANNNFDHTSSRPCAVEDAGGFGAIPHSVQRELNSGPTTHLNASNANYTSTLQTVGNDKSESLPFDFAKFGEKSDTRDSQKSLHALLKPEIEKLCAILQFPDDVEIIAQSFLEYVVHNHCVIKEPATLLQAFSISLCWRAASMLKYKVDRKETFELAKKHLDFGCRKEEADCVYSMLRSLKKMFINHRKNLAPSYATETSNPLPNVVDKVHHGMPSLSSTSNQQLEKDEFENRVPGQESVDDLRSINDIERKCGNEMEKLLQKQQEEVIQYKTNYENEKAQLEKKKKTEAAVIRLHSSSSMRMDKLIQLDVEYKKKFEELEHRMETHLENLQKRHEAAKEMMEKRKETLLQEFTTSRKRDAIVNTGNGSLNSVEKMQDREVNVEVPEIVCTSDNVEVPITGVLCTGEQNRDGTKSCMPGREAPIGVSNGGEACETMEHQDLEGPSAVNRAANVLEARQEHYIQLSGSTRSQGRTPLVAGIDNPFQQLEPSVHGADTASDHSNADVLIGNPMPQMPSTNFDISPNTVDLPSAGECEGNINLSVSPTQILGDQAVSHLPVETPEARSAPISSVANNCSTQTVPRPAQVPPLALSRDPLQNELDRICRETGHIASIHEKAKLQLISDCEKEIQEVRQKYEAKIQEVESEFLVRKKELDANCNKVFMSKMLADAFRSKCMDTKASSAHSLLQDGPSVLLQRVLQLTSQPTNGQRNILGVSPGGGSHLQPFSSAVSQTTLSSLAIARGVVPQPQPASLESHQSEATACLFNSAVHESELRTDEYPNPPSSMVDSVSNTDLAELRAGGDIRDKELTCTDEVVCFSGDDWM